MGESCTVVAAIAFLVFLTFAPTFNGAPLGLGLIVDVGESLGQIVDYSMNLIQKTEPFHPIMHKGVEIYISDPPPQPFFSNRDNVPPDAYSERVQKNLSTAEDLPIGFYIKFSIGSPPSPVTALLSISSNFIQINNYGPNLSTTLKCCNIMEEIPDCVSPSATGTTSCNGDYISDKITFSSAKIPDVVFKSLNTGTDFSDHIGYISLSRSNYSLLNNFNPKKFSYLFSTSNSYLSLGSVPNGTSGLEFTKIVQNSDYPGLYYVDLAEYSIGNSSEPIKPTTVILNTVISVTFLEKELYCKVKKKLSEIGQFVNTDPSNLTMCYKSTSILWPEITLSFPSGSGEKAQMVLTKNNYVVTNMDTGVECAALVQSPEANVSLIGSIAQLNRTMVFDLSVPEPTLYFSRYTDSRSSADSVPAGSPVKDSHAGSLMIPNLVWYLVHLLPLVFCFHIPG